METSDDVINSTSLAVSLITVIADPAMEITLATQPLAGDTGRGKAFRQVSSCRYATLLYFFSVPFSLLYFIFLWSFQLFEKPKKTLVVVFSLKV